MECACYSTGGLTPPRSPGCLELRCRWERETWILEFYPRPVVPSLSVVPQRQTVSVGKVRKAESGCLRSPRSANIMAEPGLPPRGASNLAGFVERLLQRCNKLPWLMRKLVVWNGDRAVDDESSRRQHGSFFT